MWWWGTILIVSIKIEPELQNVKIQRWTMRWTKYKYTNNTLKINTIKKGYPLRNTLFLIYKTISILFTTYYLSILILPIVPILPSARSLISRPLVTLAVAKSNVYTNDLDSAVTGK